MRPKKPFFQKNTKALNISFFLFFLSIFSLIFLGACGRKNTPPPHSIPTVLVTLAPYAFAVKEIAKDTVRVETIIPPGANAHLFEPTPGILNQDNPITVWFRIEEPLEKKLLLSIQDKGLPIKIIDLQEGLPLLSEKELTALGGCHHHTHSDRNEKEMKDLHTWVSPNLFAKQIIIIGETLSTLFPDHKENYQKNLKDLLDRIALLNTNIETILKPHQGEALLISHPSLGYFCHQYGLFQLSVECEGKDPLPKDISALLSQIEHYKIKVAFIQRGFNNQGTTLIATKLKLPIYPIDPYAENYLEMIWEIAKAFEHP